MIHRLSQMQPKAPLTGLFWYPDNADEKTGIRVKLSYTSPNLVAELTEAARIRMSANPGPGGKKWDDLTPAAQRTELLNDVLLKSVVSISGLTFVKLQNFVPIDPDAIAAAGGLEAEIPGDPKDANKELAECARDNILFLLSQSAHFERFVTLTCQNIGAFQREDWTARAKNSRAGQGTISDESKANSPGIAAPAQQNSNAVNQ